MDGTVDFGIDMDLVRSHLRLQEAERDKRLCTSWVEARRDCEQIIKRIILQCSPRRIYQWGSLLDVSKFSEISDIDIAVEGLSGILELISVLKKNMAKLEKIIESMELVYSHDLPMIGKTGTSALMVAGLLDTYYTCLETMLFRIAQFFGNSLDQTQWHRDLLENMTVPVEGVRIAPISDENFPRLLELLKFRHFRRYYFEMEYDWDRLEYLRKKLFEAHPRVLVDINHFMEFLRSI